MATVTIRNLPDKTREAIRVKAALNRRSMEAELRDLIERTYGEPERLPMEEVRRRLKEMSGGRFPSVSVDEFLAERRRESGE